MDQESTTDLDVYVKKTVSLSLSGRRLDFDVSQSLFSSHQVDVGTLHLLKTLQDHQLPESAKVLDLGCGYGPLGITLKQLNPTAQLHMVDRDALAVAFARRNADALLRDPGQEGVEGTVQVYGSLGYDDVRTVGFDLIVSNIPGKAGTSVIRALLLDAQAFLARDGMMAVVVVLPLERTVGAILDSPDIEVVRHETTSAYAIFHYRFREPAATEPWIGGFERGIYDREELTFLLDGLTLPMRTAFGLPEFDTLSFESQLLIKALQDMDEKRPYRALVFNTGQGHVPVTLWRLFAPQTIDLVDRDLLSCRYARLNLMENGCEAEAIHVHHQIGILPGGEEPDLIVGRLREDEGPEVIEQTLVRTCGPLNMGTHLLLGGGSTPITRVLKSQELGRILRPLKRRRSKGNSTALFERK